jgi:hypothetical protein
MNLARLKINSDGGIDGARRFFWFPGERLNFFFRWIEKGGSHEKKPFRLDSSSLLSARAPAGPMAL